MADPFITLNGDPGEFLSRADVNILDADTANLQQSVGLWTAGAGIATVDLVADPAARFGEFVLQGPITGANVSVSATIQTPLDGTSIPVGPGDVRTVAVDVSIAPGESEPYEAQINAVFRDIGGGNLAAVQSGFFPISDVPVRIGVTTAPAPAGTTGVSFAVAYQTVADGGRVIGDVPILDAVTMTLDGSTAWIPSLRIVGNLDLRARIALATYTPADPNAVLAKWGPEKSYQFTIEPSGTLRFFGSSDGVATDVNMGVADPGLAAGSVHDFRLFYEFDNGGGNSEGSFFIDSVLEGSVVGPLNLTLFPGNNPLNVGADATTVRWWLDGDLEFVEVYDGDGDAGAPLVYRMDAADALGSV